MNEAQKSLGSLASQISPGIGNVVACADAAQVAVTKNIDAFLAKAAKAAITAGELEVIGTKLPNSIKPEQYSGWKSVASLAGVEAAVKAYKKKFDKPLYETAKCQAVVTRAMRVMK